MDISVIIPAYNEEKRIAFTLEKSIDFLQQRSWQYELLPVDDEVEMRPLSGLRSRARVPAGALCAQRAKSR